MDMSTPDKRWGIALLNEGKYAYDTLGFPDTAPQPGTFRLTMLRTPKYPNPAGESWAHQERKARKEADGGEVPTFSGLGFLRCRYALFPHSDGALVKADGTPHGVVKKHAEEFNAPLIVRTIPENAKFIADGSSFLVHNVALISASPDHVLVTALKQKEWIPEKNLILRVVESAGVACDHVILKFHPDLAKKIKKIVATDILERPTEAIYTWDANSGQLKFAIGKFEILTFELIV
jgi:alpha-mannosidase